jgi:hypothetical protein
MVSGVQAVGNFDGYIEEAFCLHRLSIDDVFERAAIEKFHGDKTLAFVLTDFIDGANIGVIQSGGGAGFAAETFKGQRVTGQVVGKELKCDESAELGVFGLVNHAHAAAEFLENFVVGNRASSKGLGLGHGAPLLLVRGNSSQRMPAAAKRNRRN